MPAFLCGLENYSFANSRVRTSPKILLGSPRGTSAREKLKSENFTSYSAPQLAAERSLEVADFFKNFWHGSGSIGAVKTEIQGVEKTPKKV